MHYVSVSLEQYTINSGTQTHTLHAEISASLVLKMKQRGSDSEIGRERKTTSSEQKSAKNSY